MSDLIGEVNGWGIITIDEITDTHLIIDECPFCGDTHRHGNAADLDYLELTHRVSHCTDADYYNLETGGYYITIHDDTEGR